jgi:hypothetical protein
MSEIIELLDPINRVVASIIACLRTKYKTKTLLFSIIKLQGLALAKKYAEEVPCVLLAFARKPGIAAPSTLFYSLRFIRYHHALF